MQAHWARFLLFSGGLAADVRLIQASRMRAVLRPVLSLATIFGAQLPAQRLDAGGASARHGSVICLGGCGLPGFLEADDKLATGDGENVRRLQAPRNSTIRRAGSSVDAPLFLENPPLIATKTRLFRLLGNLLASP
jgi:hypothetical protein